MRRNLSLVLGLAGPLVALVGPLTGDAGAQGKGVLGRDNADFARKLFEARYVDLAGDLCRTIVENGAVGTELLEVQALGFELEVEEIGRNPDLAARIDALRKVIEKENAFIKENARTSVADVVRTNLPSVYLELAATLTTLLKTNIDTARRAELIQIGQSAFIEGKSSLRERIDRWEKVIATGTGDQEYALRQHMTALYNLARMNFQNSLLYPEGSPDRTELLETALQGFKDFGYEYSESFLNYQGIIYQGLCREGLGEEEDALQDYQDVFDFRLGFEPDADGKYQVGPDLADLISGATLQRVKLLTRLRRFREAVLVADEYMSSIPDAALAQSGVEVLEAKAEAEMAAGDVAGASATAQALVDLEAQVPNAGRVGRLMLSKLPVDNLAPDKILGIAETSALKGEFGRALDLCRRARETAKGARDEPAVGGASYFLIGNIYRTQKRLHEASLAFDLAAELYPTSPRAPDALNASINVYREIAKREKARFYSERANQQMNALATKYPQHEAAANAGIWQGLRREDEGDVAGAIQFYEKIAPGSPSFHEASYRRASATHSQAQELQRAGKTAEAEPVLAKAQGLYEKSIELLEKAQEETLDSAVQQKLGNWIFSAQVGLSTLLIDSGRAAEVEPILAEAETRAGSDPDRSAAVWSLRIQGLQAEGKLDEAVRLFEALLQGSKDAPAVPRSAGFLARALDQAAQDEATKDPASKRAEELWRKAAFYYSISVERALAGAAALQADDVGEVAQRLYVLGLFFNRVPEGQVTFVDWQGERLDSELWEKTADVYQRLESQAPSIRISIEHARTLAILGRLQEAEAIYARMFDQVSLFDAAGRFDRAVIEARPELVSAYLEWGVASHLIGLEPRDEGRLERAKDIYKRILDNTTSDSRLWWQAKYFQIKLLSDRGVYDQADMAIGSTKRTTSPQFDDGRFGFKEKFLALEAELAKKVFKKK